MPGDLLQKKKKAIGERWLASLLATYGEDTAAFLRQQKNRFANPVGRTFADASRAILDEVLDGMDAANLCAHLEEIIKIRAIQEFSPAAAVSFVFLLKDAVREEIGDAAREPDILVELHEIETRIDQLALFAFDIYVKRREQVYSLRLREIRNGFAEPA
ncbi:RsbRD N-terminal domain-containing protein [bacterium]|nr:RsbRD N-terminal domain-containing protein [bacterium]MBU1073876.1 RsbRD N-terminal domain-containing protein [bacterium]MBU1676794.1 RsbRD N-terminal domain-containing protein [bacterium]